MSAYKDNFDDDSVKKREYLKQQHQLRTMTKSNNILSADAMIENLLSKKEIFKKKDQNLSSNKPPQVNYPGWLLPGHEPLLYKRVWDIVCTPSGYADTPKLTNILLTSRLPTDILGYIWSLSNISLAPALSQTETYTSLALVALVQSGYSFTGVAVLNTLKEAPLPKLDYPLTDVSPMIQSPVFMPIVQPPMQQPSYTQVPPVSHTFAEFNLSEEKKTPDTLPLPKETVISSQITPSIPPASTSGSTDTFSLLDLDLSLPSTSVKPDLMNSVSNTSSTNFINHSDITVDLLKDVSDVVKQSKNKELISEFSPTSKKHNNLNLVSPVSESKLSTSICQIKAVHEPSLIDDMFGDFQCVNVTDQKSSDLDEIEFDDFKSADFTPLNLLEVKEKPVEKETDKSVPAVKEIKSQPHKAEEKTGIEDLFPKCVVKTQDDGFDLLAGDEDKYSALRGLSVSDDTDEFGDFLTAVPSQPSSIPPPFASLQTNIQERAMEASIQVLEEAKKIFESIDEEEVLKEVISDPRGVQYLEELIEVQRIAERLRTTLNKEDLCAKLESVSCYLEEYLKPHKNSYMAEEKGPKCGICLCDKGPSYVKYGINNFHAPCANLYLHRVDSILPIAPVM